MDDDALSPTGADTCEEAKPPKSKRLRVQRKKVKKSEGEGDSGAEMGGTIDIAGFEIPLESGSRSAGDDSTGLGLSDGGGGDSTAQNTVAVTPSAVAKKKKPKVKSATPSKKKPNKTTISFSKKKKRPLCDDEEKGSDLEGTPPPSPPPDDENSTKRRSGRNRSRKKYIDDIDLSLSDAEVPAPGGTKGGNDSQSGEALDPTGTASVEIPMDIDQSESGIKPNFVYVNTTDEDTMVVQHILSVRTGTREVVSSDDEDEEEATNKPPEKLAEVPASVPEKVIEERINLKSEEEVVPKELELVDAPKEQATTVSDVENGNPPTEEEEAKLKPAAMDVSDVPSSTATETIKEDNVEATPKPKKNKKPPRMIEVEEFYVKYKNFSYLHCEWRTEEELLRGDKRVTQKLKRFHQKRAQAANMFEFLEEDLYNPDYVEVDRVLDKVEHTDAATGKTTRNFLVKWKSLPYEDSTWELEEDVDPIKIKAYEEANKFPTIKDTFKGRKKPRPSEWKKLDESPVYLNGNTLREYQLEGLNWLSFSWFNGRNCILADEMGLGKTIQSLAFIDSVHRVGIRGPFLVIAPLSTIPNWQREFETWTNLNIIVYHGSNASRNMLQEYEFYFKDDGKGQQNKEIFKFNVLITTFEMIISDCMELREIPWRLCVIDEAHRLKNKNCKLLEGLRLLQMEHRVLLSGTPLQNNISELYSLLNFLEPQQFQSSEDFIRDFGDLKSDEQVQKLQAILKPMMLRRLKEDVEKSLAPKEETIIEVELTNMQKKYYRGILERNFSFLTKGTTNANVPNLMNTMMELRKCCIHPYLLNGAEEQIQYEMKVPHSADPDLHHKALIQSSGKLVLVDKLLPKLRSNGHRVLIFSQMVRCLDILEDYLIYRKYPYERLDGRIRGNMRQAAIDRFSKPDSDRFVFLLCTKAGGLGINLTAADTVIIYDSDWNPQNDLQAQARCHRIGQQKMVKVYRLLTRNTYEREMFDKASLKLGLDKAVLQSMNTSQGGKDYGNPSKQLSKKEIEDLLKKGAYGALMEDDNAGDKFCEEDIDQILLRRTQIITLENEKGSTFSKASFASAADRTDIDIDDPDFWKKWAKRAEIDTEQMTNGEVDLVLSEPRRRTQIKRYGQDEGVMDVSDLETTSNSDEEPGVPSTRSKVAGRKDRSGRRSLRRSRRGNYDEDFAPDDGEIEYGGWSKNECFKVEKGLMTFGWGRWREIMAHGQFRKGWREADVEDCARLMVVYCLLNFRGDEKIKSFTWELITPPENGADLARSVDRNHSGISTPVQRGSRKSKKESSSTKKGKGATPGSAVPLVDGAEWTRDEKYDPEQFLDSGYRRHVTRHANKVLLRMRMLYYIKQEIIRDLEIQVNGGVNAAMLPIQPPLCDQPPTPWWDNQADVSLLVGTYKHGYERYAVMRLDPSLCFLMRCGPPDKQELLSEMASLEANGDELDKAPDEDDDIDDDSSSTTQGPTANSKNAQISTSTPIAAGPGEKFQFPPSAELNTRLRRLITSYQRNFKKEEAKMAQKAKRMERREKIETIVREREKQKVELQQRRWTRREEGDFFRTISNFGVEYNKKLGRYDWTRFRAISRLERKYDETLTEYLRAFCAMCKKACGRKLTDEEEVAQAMVEPIGEDRARRCLERLELLCKIREEVLSHPKLEDRLKLCQPSLDLPDWWVCGKHDRDLLLGAARHGLGRTDFYYVHDPELGFREILRRHYAGEPLIYPQEKKERDKIENPISEIKANTEVGPHRSKKSIKGEEDSRRKKFKTDEEPTSDKNIKDQSTEEINDEAVLSLEKKPSTSPQLVKDEKENQLDEPIPENVSDLSSSIKKVKDTPKEKVDTLEMDLNDPEINEIAPKETDVGAETVEDELKKSPINLTETDTHVAEKEKFSHPEDDAVMEPETEKISSDETIPSRSEPQTTEETEEVLEEKEKEPELAKSDGTPIVSGNGTEKMDVDEPVKSDESKEPEKIETRLTAEKTTEEAEMDVSRKPNESKDAKLEELVTAKSPSSQEGGEAKPDKTSDDKVQDEVMDMSDPVSSVKTEEDPEEKPKMKKLKLETVNEGVKEESSRSSEEKTSEISPEAEIVQAKIEKRRERLPRGEKKEKEFVPPTLESVAQMDEAMARQGLLLDPELLANGDPAVLQILAQTYQNPIRWPKDRAIEARLQHIVLAVEKNEWPVGRDYSVFANGILESDRLTPELSCSSPTPGGVSGLRDTPTPASVSAMSLSDASDIMMLNSGLDRASAAEAFGLGLLQSSRRGNGRGRGRGRGRGGRTPSGQRSVNAMGGINMDVEQERAKLRALLSLNHSMQRSLTQQLTGKAMLIDEDDLGSHHRGSPSETSVSLRSKQRGSHHSGVPPPAHQHGSSSSSSRSAQAQSHALSAHALELMLAQAAQAQAHVMQAAQAQNNAAAAQAIASSMAALGLPPSISVSVTMKGSENSSAPMDLSGGLGKSRVTGEQLNGELPSDDRKRKASAASLAAAAAAADEAMPPPGAEKKRRKLDDIVKGLSAAKGQSGIAGLFASPRAQKTTTSSSADTSSNPLGLSFPRSSGITIMPCTKDSSSKEDKFSKDSAAKLTAQVQAEAQALLVGLSRMPGMSALASPSTSSNRAGTEAPRISIEPLRNSGSSAVVGDLASPAAIGKLPDFLLQKLDAYSHTPPHELKVSKWLADQQGITPERPTSPDADLLDAKRRRKPRIDPSLLDWNRLSGEENVSVINRLTGKKITGNKAPHLRNLAQWLLANPMFDVDPKWSDLVKEKGNLPGDLQRRVTGGSGSTSGAPSVAALAAAAAAASVSTGLSSPSTSSAAGLNDRKRTERGRVSSSAAAGGTSSRATPSSSSPAIPGTSASPSTSSGLNLANFPGLNPNFLSSLPHMGLDPKTNPLLAAFDPKMFGALDPKTAAALFGASLAGVSASVDPKSSSGGGNSSSNSNQLAGLDAKSSALLSSLSDPKNPLSMFGGFPGLGALGGLGNFGALGNMGAMSNMGPLFSNLAGFMPELAAASGASPSSAPTGKTSSASRREDKGKKPVASSSSSAAAAAAAAASNNANNAAAAAAAASLPFLFPNPGMLYGHLGLGSLGPFSLPTGIPLSTAFSNLGFMNGLTTTVANDPGSTSTKTTASSQQPGRGSSSRRERERGGDGPSHSAKDVGASSSATPTPAASERKSRERSSHGLDLTPARSSRSGESSSETPSRSERRSRTATTPDDDVANGGGRKKSSGKLKLDDGDN